MIVLITDSNGVEVITNVRAIQMVEHHPAATGSRTYVRIIREDDRADTGTVELHEARVELLPDDPDA